MGDLWNAFKICIRCALKEFRNDRSNIVGLAITDQGDTFVPVDNNNRPLGNAITYLDNRSLKESELLEKELGIDRVFTVTGQPHILPPYPATKILWIRENDPRLFEDAAMYVPIEDYLIYQLTGSMVCDYSGACMTLMFDIQKKKWWNEILQFLKIYENQLPELKPSGSLVGSITREASKETGLSYKTLVSTGAHDHAAAAMGAGNIRPGIATESTGAVLGVTTTINEPFYDEKRSILCNCHAVEDKYLLLLVGRTGGMVLKWFRDEFCEAEISVAKRRKVDAYDLLSAGASKIPPGSHGLIMIPHLMGAGTPENNPNAKGVFFGLTLGHTKGHMVRAIMESVAFMLRRNLDILDQNGIHMEEIRSIGGGARSQLWNQIKADVTQRRVVTLKTDESASLGVAMLAGVSSGIFSSTTTACETMVSLATEYLPNPQNRRTYDARFNTYVELYEDVKDLFKPETE
jgi:xylulokinase